MAAVTDAPTKLDNISVTIYTNRDIIGKISNIIDDKLQMVHTCSYHSQLKIYSMI